MRTKELVIRLLAVSLLMVSGISFSSGQGDSVTLDYTQYLDYVLNYHPIAEQSDLKIDMGNAELLDAEGRLDPSIKSDWEQKNLSDKLYYRKYSAKLRVPTLLGIEVVGGYENTDGVFLNPENNIDNWGLWHIGIEVDVLQGLVVNERKIALEQAAVFRDMAENEQEVMLNDLVYDASVSYLVWQRYHHYKEVLEENVTLTKVYFNNTRESYLNGEYTAMDTLEAYILYQDAINSEQKNESYLIKSRQQIENYLWFNGTPVMLNETTIPEKYDNAFLPIEKMILDSNISDNPSIRATANKLSYYEIEQKLKREKLKPKLKVKYNPLISTTRNSIVPDYAVTDQKFGLDFSMPILMRRERADIERANIKIRDAELELQDKRNQLQNKIDNSRRQQSILLGQSQILSDNVFRYQLLLEGEGEKFKYGESSVFLLNKRQEKYIDSRLKLIGVYVDYQLEQLNYLYYSNQLVD